MAKGNEIICINLGERRILRAERGRKPELVPADNRRPEKKLLSPSLEPVDKKD